MSDNNILKLDNENTEDHAAALCKEITEALGRHGPYVSPIMAMGIFFSNAVEIFGNMAMQNQMNQAAMLRRAQEAARRIKPDLQ